MIDSHWANNAIQSAVSRGYFKGYADGTYNPMHL
ncbi:S-layer homology domain-containing protein [Paenibacillus sp. USHLN196]